MNNTSNIYNIYGKSRRTYKFIAFSTRTNININNKKDKWKFLHRLVDSDDFLPQSSDIMKF